MQQRNRHSLHATNPSTCQACCGANCCAASPTSRSRHRACSQRTSTVRQRTRLTPACWLSTACCGMRYLKRNLARRQWTRINRRQVSRSFMHGRIRRCPFAARMFAALLYWLVYHQAGCDACRRAAGFETGHAINANNDYSAGSQRAQAWDDLEGECSELQVAMHQLPTPA
jgi:hypothetical protein